MVEWLLPYLPDCSSGWLYNNYIIGPTKLKLVEIGGCSTEFRKLPPTQIFPALYPASVSIVSQGWSELCYPL